MELPKKDRFLEILPTLERLNNVFCTKALDSEENCRITFRECSLLKLKFIRLCLY